MKISYWCHRFLKFDSVKNIKTRSCQNFSHVSPNSNYPKMVDISGKAVTYRRAHARCFVEFPNNVYEKLINVSAHTEIHSLKGPVFSTAIVAGVMASKNAHHLIPFCHSVALDDCCIEIIPDDCRLNSLRIDCIVSTTSKTGVEMEALVGASTASLTVYDMCKSMSHSIRITDLHLVSKLGGKSSPHQ